jgi:hypothetical protein
MAREKRDLRLKALQDELDVLLVISDLVSQILPSLCDQRAIMRPLQTPFEGQRDHDADGHDTNVDRRLFHLAFMRDRICAGRGSFLSVRTAWHLHPKTDISRPESQLRAKSRHVVIGGAVPAVADLNAPVGAALLICPKVEAPKAGLR